MKIKKMVLSIGLVFLFMLCLTGCSQKRVDVQTVLILKDDHSGSRQMRLTINKKDFEAVFTGSVDALKEQLQENIPSALEWNPSDDGETYGFTFTLYFSSLEDYEKKVEEIIGRKTSITMEQPQSVFASGLRYQEDFTSIDLMGWVGDLLVSQGYLNQEAAKTLFEESAATVSFRGTEYEQKAGALQIDTLIETPVERIDFLTHYLQNKHCDRQVVFTFSESSMNKNGEAIRSYLEKQTPDGAELSWTERNGDSQCTISARDLTSKALNTFMRKLFGESRSFISTQPQTRKGIFASASVWNELVDVSALSYNGGKVAVGYYVQWEDGMDLTIHRQNTDAAYELKDSEQYGGYQTVLELDMTTESLVTEVSTTYIIEDIEVDTEFNKADYLSRNIALVFRVKPDANDLETIRKRIARKAEGIAEVAVDEERSDERIAITITQSGSVEEMNRGLDAVFEMQGQLSHETRGDLLEFKHAGSFVDLMDFTGFIENDPILTTLTYHLRLPGGESILEDTISSTISLKQGSQEVDENEYTGIVTGAYLSLTLDSEVWNNDGIMLFMLILGFAVAVLAVVFLADTLRKTCLKMKEKTAEVHKSFGVDQELEEESPEEEEEKAAYAQEVPNQQDEQKRTFFSFLKRAPYVRYEEVKFEEGDSEVDPEQMVERITESSLDLDEEQDSTKR